MISHGRQVYEQALQDPDSLGDLYNPREGVQLEHYGYAAFNVYQRKTGQALDLTGWDYAWRPGPGGEQWEEEDLPKLLPKAYQRAAKQWGYPDAR